MRCLKSAKAGKATVIGEKFHQYAPQGVSGMVIIAESHIAVHTWPEFAYAAVDIFTCGNTVDVWAIKDSLAEAFTAGNVTVVELKRGLIREPVPDQYPRVNPPSIK